MTERRLNVEVLLGGSSEDSRRREIHAEPDRPDEEHPAAEDVRRIIQSAERFHEHPDRDRDQR